MSIIFMHTAALGLFIFFFSPLRYAPASSALPVNTAEYVGSEEATTTIVYSH